MGDDRSTETGAGYLADRLLSVNEASTLRMANRARELRAEGRSIVSLSTGEPDFPTPQNIKDAGIRAIKADVTKYTAVEGMLELREAIAAKFRNENHIDTTADRIQVSSGGKHALSNAVMSIVNPGDEVLIPSPYWVSYPAMVAIAEGVPKIVRTTIDGGWLMSPVELERAITPKTRALILNTPTNPTSTLYAREQLLALVPVIARSGIMVIVDELYEHLTYDGHRHFSIGSVPEIAEQVITVNGLSKAYSMTGWRIGYATGPKHIIAGMNRLQSQVVSHPSSISQMAAIEALTGPQDSVELMRLAFERRRDLVLELVKDIPHIRYTKPTAAFYLFFEVSEYLGSKFATSTALCEYLLEEQGVALVAGDGFGASDCIRLSFAASDEAIVEGIRRMRHGLGTALQQSSA